MRSLFTLVQLLTATALISHVETHANVIPATPKVDIQTYSETCAGAANGSAYIQSASADWQMRIYRNGTLLNTLAVASRDTFIHGLSIGCYSFEYVAKDGSTATISKIVSAPNNIISTCRVHYLDSPEQNVVSFINYSSGAVTFDWDFGDGEHSAEISPEHIYTKPGTYTVTLTAYNINACQATSTYTIVIPDSKETGMNNSFLPK